MFPEEKVYSPMGRIKGERWRNHVPRVMMDGMGPATGQYNACPQSLGSSFATGRQ